MKLRRTRPAPESARVSPIIAFYHHPQINVLLPFHLAVAIAVTVHALLYKREVGSALGWIGLSWLAPFVGGFLYFVAGINRVRRRAQRLRRKTRTRRQAQEIDEDPNDDLEPLQRGVTRISRRPLEIGNAFEVYQNGDEAYPPMLSAINEATRSIGLSSYIFGTDEIGMRFIEALEAATKRGVEVRVIIDGIGGNWILSQAYHALKRRGVPAGRFLHSPLPWRMPLVNLRSHKKILVVDGKVGFTGGMNIRDENVMATHPKHPVADTHFKVTGPVVSQLVDAFADDWAFVTGEDLEGDDWFPDLAKTGAAKARVLTSGPDQDVEKIEFCVMQAIACARETIDVMTPYFLPDDRLLTALSLAAMRGVKVNVLIPKRSNKRIVDWATRANIGSMLKDGVRVRLGAPPFRHSKLMVVDSEWCLIGSANWDLRSFRLNFELCMEVYDESLALGLKRFVARQASEPLSDKDIKARTLPVRLRDAAVRLAMPYL
ncbi:Cardiolipin synthase [Beijerinckiaceae bacterium RH AL1]|nr:phospholipase D-like domain-containing protein [Beijerinckiaceae bacterium]VVB47178.1 Cardiolipin synthase [Beijerinckiaceae bacterium RH CH11]VVB47261.1 Cardiolipin synthase [Beijerinckiaceae bacterium RH AL8]VVC55754.1 Cardiolipin synthase [Beijerinckiaceae bacterium RH AL1]